MLSRRNNIHLILCTSLFFGVYSQADENRQPSSIQKPNFVEIKPALNVAISSERGMCVRTDVEFPRNRCEILAPKNQCSDILEKQLEKSTQSGRLELLRKLADYYVRNGPVEKAVEYYQKIYDHSVANKLPANEDLLLNLAIAQLRQGEVVNCRVNHNSDTCIFPLSGDAFHKDKRGSKGATDTLKILLGMHPDNAHFRWLLNFAYMTLGEYPDNVPLEYLIPEKNFISVESFPKFRNIEPDLHFNRQAYAGGIIIDDFTNDGNLDVVMSSIGYCDPLAFMVNNNGISGFSNKTSGSGFDEQYNASHMIQADYDNDGLLDIYITRGLWEFPNEPMEFEWAVPVYNSLMHNLGEGRFEDVTDKMGLNKGRSFNITSLWGDFNNDGFVDLFVCNNQQAPLLFINEKGLHFKHADYDTGLVNDEMCMGGAAGDVNNDGLLDIFLSSRPTRLPVAKSQLFINKGNAHFQKDIAFENVVPGFSAFSSWFMDYDNDGLLDIFIAAYNYDVKMFNNVGDMMSKQPYKDEHVVILHNIGMGKFAQVEMGLDNAILVMGANFGDFDNDGYEDLLLGTGAPPLDLIMPNRAFRNKSGKSFADVTFASGFGNVQKGHGIGFGDLDNDGDQDVIAMLGGWYVVDTFAPSVYENPGFSNNWITLRLEGVKANRSAIGSDIKLDISEGGIKRQIHRVITSGGSFGSSSLQAEIGLGKADKIEKLTIQWAGSKSKTVLKNIAANQIVKIVEGASTFVSINQPVVVFKHKDADIMNHHHNENPF